MKKNVLWVTNLAFVAAATVLVLLSVFSYQRINEQAKASDVVSSTQLLKFKLNDAFSHLIKAETAQRGYLLTGDSSFLLDYFLAKQPVTRLLSEVRTLTSNNVEQQNNFKTASYLFQLRFDYIQNTLARSHNISRLLLDTLLLKGKYITDNLSRQIEKMISTENFLLETRIAKLQREENRTSIFILLLSALSVIILIFSFFKVKKETINSNLLEQKVRERTEELKIANVTLNKQYVELKRKNDELSSFTFIANHDLREPLRKIEFFTNRIVDSDERFSTTNRELLAKTVDCVKRMKVLLEDIFIYTMADKTVKFEKTDLNDIAAKAISQLSESIEEKDAVISYQNLPQVKAIPTQMVQVFTNILSNSLKYSKKNVKPYISIEAVKQNGNGSTPFWRISFKDNGIGFKEELGEKIFLMFQRLHLKNEYSGTGMGLTICKKIIENHQGTITASSKIGEGAVFTIFLPEEPKESL